MSAIEYRPADSHEWKSHAECAKPDRPLMFPHEADEVGVMQAKATCAVCPVVAECLEAAHRGGEHFGVWGGLTSEERRAARRREHRKGSDERYLKQRAEQRAARRQSVAQPKPVTDVDLDAVAGLL